ncbi:MAG: DUF6457 domain-containing protein [Solirubrobacteraceae bacterium]
MNAKEWIAAYARRLGTEPPSADEFKALLDLAGEAAHCSERVAAPVACWVTAKAGCSLQDALAPAREVSRASARPDATTAPPPGEA